MAITLTSEQSAARSFFCANTQDAFILRGSAGTGKTTLIAKFIETLEKMNLSCAPLAPTGRAALTQVEVTEGAETTNDPLRGY